MRPGLNSHIPCWQYTYTKKLEIHMWNNEIRFQISHHRRGKVTYVLRNKFILIRISGCPDFIRISTLSKNSYIYVVGDLENFTICSLPKANYFRVDCKKPINWQALCEIYVQALCEIYVYLFNWPEFISAHCKEPKCIQVD